VTQWANLANELATLVQRYQGNISSIIPATVNNITEFIDFASTGAFSINPLPDASAQSDILVQILNTFVIARAFTANNVVLAQAPDTDINDLQATAGDELAYDTGCGHGYDEYSICGPFWFDPRVKTTFSLDNLGEMTKDYHDDMRTIFSNWTTPDMLFGNAYRCAKSGGDANGPTIRTNSDGSVEIDCLSDIKICTWNQESLDFDKEFSDCPMQGNFGTRGVCSGGDCGDSEGSIIGVNVPAGYAGIYLYGAPPNYCVCNT
ncbi:MAG: hypothetical protein Q9214_007601, partial [Letrouitia sp. 1 TL-2023]